MRKRLATLILGLAVAGCGGTSTVKHDPSTVAPPGAAKGAVLQMRVVLRTSDATVDAPGSRVPEVWLSRLAHFTCPRGDLPVSNPHSYLIACDTTKNRYLLAPAAWQGRVQNATAGYAAGTWAVDFSLDAGGTRALDTQSRELYMSRGRLALVLGGRVLSAPGFDGVITDGAVQIAGDFNETTANALVGRLTGR